jgi:hypothetical protein
MAVQHAMDLPNPPKHLDGREQAQQRAKGQHEDGQCQLLRWPPLEEGGDGREWEKHFHGESGVKCPERKKVGDILRSTFVPMVNCLLEYDGSIPKLVVPMQWMREES